MKKAFSALLGLLLIGFGACKSMVPEAPYSDILKEHYDLLFDEDIDPYVRYYTFQDIDNDGIEELLLGYEATVGVALISVFVIHNNDAVHQEQFSVDPEYPVLSLLFKNGTIRNSGNDESGGLFYTYFLLEDGELKLQTVLTDNWDGYFQFDGKKDISITKEEFDQLAKEFEGDGQVVELDWKPLAEYGR